MQIIGGIFLTKVFLIELISLLAKRPTHDKSVCKLVATLESIEPLLTTTEQFFVLGKLHSKLGLRICKIVCARFSEEVYIQFEEVW